MTEIDELVRRTVDTVTMIAARALRFTGKLLLGVVVVVVGGFLLGVRALSGGVEQVWIVLGVAFGTLAIGSVLLAWWRIGSVRRHVPELADEVRGLLADGRDGTRTVIESFVIGDAPPGGTANELAGSAIVLSRRVGGFRSAAGSTLAHSTRLMAAVTALTSFPALVLLAVAISLVFACSGFVFLIALAL